MRYITWSMHNLSAVTRRVMQLVRHQVWFPILLYIHTVVHTYHVGGLAHGENKIRCTYILGNKNLIRTPFPFFTVHFISFHFQTPIVVGLSIFHAMRLLHAVSETGMSFWIICSLFLLGFYVRPCCAVWVFTRWTIQFLASAIYSLYFGPLAKYPGPFFAKISAWPNFYHSLGGDRHIWLWQCHQIYGTSLSPRNLATLLMLITPSRPSFSL